MFGEEGLLEKLVQVRPPGLFDKGFITMSLLVFFCRTHLFFDVPVVMMVDDQIRHIRFETHAEKENLLISFSTHCQTKP